LPEWEKNAFKFKAIHFLTYHQQMRVINKD
jgi:hypothetical protein